MCCTLIAYLSAYYYVLAASTTTGTVTVVLSSFDSSGTGTHLTLLHGACDSTEHTSSPCRLNLNAQSCFTSQCNTFEFVTSSLQSAQSSNILQQCPVRAASDNFPSQLPSYNYTRAPSHGLANSSVAVPSVDFPLGLAKAFFSFFLTAMRCSSRKNPY